MNLMELFIKIEADGVEKTKSKVGSLSAFTVAKGQLIAKGLEKGAEAVYKLVKDSITAFADYEQLEGGIKKLFGDAAAKTVMENADKAFKTAGMSANDYMSAATKFSAKLINDLGGDTAKAAEYTDKAIRAMSDNANTFGTDISLVQNAFSGFARQNYTMLDSLSLGYGGTASEMARLINDSGVLGDQITVTAGNINRVSFDTIIDAIEKVQSEMGITGTTFNEAEKTISGSIAAVKSSWKNLLASISSGSDNTDEKLEQFIDSVGNLGDLLAPRINVAIDAIGTIVQSLPATLDAIAPSAVDSAFKIIDSISNMLLNKNESGKSGAEILAETAVKIITALVEGLTKRLSDSEGAKEVIDAGVGVLTALADGITDNVKIISNTVPDIVSAFVSALWEEDTYTSLWEMGRSMLNAVVIGIFSLKNLIPNTLKEIIETSINQISAMFGFKTKVDLDFTIKDIKDWISGSHADGLSYVPFDGYVAELHKGERVLTAAEAKAYNNGASGSQLINITINGASYSDEQSLADAVVNALQTALNRRNAAYA